MLRKADNITVHHRPSFWTGKGPVHISIGRQTYVLTGKLTKAGFRARLDRQRQYPVCVARIGERRYWQFQNRFYWDDEGLKADQVYALITTRKQRRNQQIERAQATVAMGRVPRGAAVRRGIPDDLKQLVWTRDGGRCRHCGATTELQFDHIIPLAKGGSSNAENLQVLCGPCNRQKSDGLTVRR